MNLQNLTIVWSAKYAEGKDDDRERSCDAKGGDGAEGLRLRGSAWNVEIKISM